MPISCILRKNSTGQIVLQCPWSIFFCALLNFPCRLHVDNHTDFNPFVSLLKGCSQGTIATVIYSSKLMDCMRLSVVVTIAPCEHLHKSFSQFIQSCLEWQYWHQRILQQQKSYLQWGSTWWSLDQEIKRHIFNANFVYFKKKLDLVNTWYGWDAAVLLVYCRLSQRF